MFDVVRGVPASGSYPAAPARDVAPPESAWERGLRTAKEVCYILSLLLLIMRVYQYYRRTMSRNVIHMSTINILTKQLYVNISYIIL